MKKRVLNFTDEEDRELITRARQEGGTVSTLIRAGVGLPPLERGGVREGAGRKPAKKRGGRAANPALQGFL